MTTEVNVDKLVQQTQKYEFSDGLRDLQLALLLICMGIVTWLSTERFWLTLIVSWSQTFGRWAAFASMLIVFVPALIALGMLGVMNLLRRRWLWRETGMVKPVRIIVPRRVSVISAVILMASVGVGFLLRQFGWADDGLVLRMLWVGTGWSFGYTLVGLGRNIDLARYVRLGAIGGLGSTLFLFLPVAFGQAALMLCLFWSILLSISGTITLRAALRPARETSHAG